jgi:hypothetical protein
MHVLKGGFGVAQALHSIPRNRSEWLVWMDMDTIIGNMPFVFPYQSYAGKDLVLWGEAEKIKKGDTQGMPAVRNGMGPCR